MAKSEPPKVEFPKFEGPAALTDFLKSFDFTKAFGDLKIPGFDPHGLIETQKKNFEALVAANKLAAEGVQAVATRQAEIVRHTVEGFASAVRDVTAGGPENIAARQAEFVKAQFEKAIANLRELTELTQKSNGEVIELLNKRFKEALEEIKAPAKK